MIIIRFKSADTCFMRRTMNQAAFDIVATIDVGSKKGKCRILRMNMINNHIHT